MQECVPSFLPNSSNALNHQTPDIAHFVEQFINQTNHSIFLTGKAGTGKTTLLRKIKETTYKNVAIVAPTGIAALNAGGVTIHSFFQLPFSGFIPEFGQQPNFSDSLKFETKDSLRRHFTMNKTRLQLIRGLELLIIDEVSMLRADLLDAIDWCLRNVRRNHSPFGGLQVLFIGDLLQLPPVVKQEEWSVLSAHYKGIFFFHAKVFEEGPPLYIELSKIYRQQDQAFIELLNNLRNNQISEADVKLLNAYVQPEFDSSQHEGYITLTTHNHKADQINAKALAELNGDLLDYSAEIHGEFPAQLYPIEEILSLKVGAQVMFIKNDLSFDKQFYNGKMGKIAQLSENEISVYFPEEKKTITVEKYEWRNIRYVYNEGSGEIEEESLGTFVHYPLKLAWAITVHKSQGLTFDKAVLDVAAVFAPGQAYVALSRLRSLDGLILTQALRMNGLSNDAHVVAYANQKAPEEQLPAFLAKQTQRFLIANLQEAFDFYELCSKWNIHFASYQMAGPRTEKGKNKAWMTLQNQAIQATNEPAQKFVRQLQQIGAAPHFDLQFLAERMNAAYQYFFKILDGVLSSNLQQIAILSTVRKTKQYAEELLELDAVLTQTILQLKKVRLLTDALAAGKTLSKELVINAEITQYKSNKVASLQQELKPAPSLLDDPAPDYTAVFKNADKKATQEKKEKKNTYEQTLEWHKAGKDIAEIAQLRQVSKQTIYTHMALLIKTGQIELSEIMSSGRIAELSTYFEGYQESSLGPLKEQVGNKATWDELKVYQAYLQTQ